LSDQVTTNATTATITATTQVKTPQSIVPIINSPESPTAASYEHQFD
jgi:hypothetical protein